MTTEHYVALLRGINVGRAKRVAMADLRQLLGSLGYGDVRTLLNSGNVVFSSLPLDTAAAATAIEEALILKLGVASRVTVLHAGELQDMLDEAPLLPMCTDPARLLVFVLADPSHRTLAEPLAMQDWTPGALALGRRSVHVWCPSGVLDSPAVAALGKQLGDAITSRNWATLSKLHALCSTARGGAG